MSKHMSISNPEMLKGQIPATRAWHGPDLVDDDFKIILSRDCMAELEAIVAEQRKAPVPTLVLLPEHFEMSACRKLMENVRQRLDSGLGFVILDRLPVERLEPAGAHRHLLAAGELAGAARRPGVVRYA